MPALCGLTGGHGHEYVPLSDTTLAGTMLMGAVFHWRMTRVVRVVLIPTFTSCRKLAMGLFVVGKRGSTMAKLSQNGGAALVFLLSALAFWIVADDCAYKVADRFCD
jgi:hypothetical protein